MALPILKYKNIPFNEGTKLIFTASLPDFSPNTDIVVKFSLPSPDAVKVHYYANGFSSTVSLYDAFGNFLKTLPSVANSTTYTAFDSAYILPKGDYFVSIPASTTNGNVGIGITSSSGTNYNSLSPAGNSPSIYYDYVTPPSISDLQTSVTALTADKTALQTSVTALTADKTALQTSVTALTADKTALTAEKTQALSDKATALTAKTVAESARDTALAEKATVLAEKIAAETARDTALAEKTIVESTLQTVTTERNAYFEEKSTLNLRYQEVVSAYVDLAAVKDKALSDLDAVTVERNNALDELNNALSSVSSGEIFSVVQQSAVSSLSDAISANPLPFFEDALILLSDKKQVASDSANVVFNGSGNLKFTADARSNFIGGNAGNNVIKAGDGSDTINGGAGDDVISGGNGDDFIISLSGRNKLNGDAGHDSLIGSVQEDTIDGGVGNDTVFGGGGHDVIKGNKGDDSLIGSIFNDSIDGGDDNDFINGGDGVNKLVGGKGNDTIQSGKHDDFIDGGDDNDFIDAGDGKNDVKGGKGNDTIQSGNGNDKIDSGDGDDLINVGLGDNNVKGGKGNDIINSQSGNDSIDGGDGNDMLDGGDGHDVILGGKGDDRIVSGLGNDTLTGGADSDLFVLSFIDDNLKTITDFKSGVDILAFADPASGSFPLDSSDFVTSITSVFVFNHEFPAFAYNTKTGAFFYDSDGSGVAAQVQIALIANKAPLVASDILI